MIRRRRVLPLGHVLALGLVVAIAATGLVPSSNAARDVSPGTFSRVSSGVALIRTYGCGGRALGLGTGFLVGTSVVMTARHVVTGACQIRIRVSGENFKASGWSAWSGGGASRSAADVATIKLDHAAGGYIFRVRTLPIRVGVNLGMVGYPLGNRLSLNRESSSTEGRSTALR
jgi:hypothetical protein